MTGRRGGVLLEVLVALVILSTAAVELASLVSTGLGAVAHARAREPRYREAGAVLARLSLRSKRELDIRLGDRTEAGYLTNVQRPRPTLYRIAVLDPDVPSEELVVTIVHRPEPQ